MDSSCEAAPLALSPQLQSPSQQVELGSLSIETSTRTPTADEELLRIRRKVPGLKKVAVLSLGTLTGAIGGWAMGVIALYLMASMSLLDFQPLTAAAVALTLFILCLIGCAGLGMAYGFKVLERQRFVRPWARPRTSAGGPPKSIRCGPWGMCSYLILLVFASMLVSAPSPEQRLLSLLLSTLGGGQPADGLPLGYCAEAGAEPTDGGLPVADGSGNGDDSHEGGSTQTVHRRRATPSAWWREHGDSAHVAAARLVALMSAGEKARLVQGVGWKGYELGKNFYVGSIYAVPRLGVPSIRMQDASQGFRPMRRSQVGQSTAWPSMLALAATWDPPLARRYAAAVGDEFKAKGANVVLGPAVNVHRVPRNGRNAEYLSGEDPYLGAALTYEYVRGVQGAGVAAVVKHFVLNHQEENRNTESSNADDRTLWEAYYPPFAAAVRAGAASVMCAYNVINGTHACGNSRILTAHLKRQMNFSGFVMSDWWAVHSGTAAAAGGVDQNMPGGDDAFGDLLSSAPDSKPTGGGGRTAAALIDEMATRVLRGMIGSSAFDEPGCTLGCDCGTLLYDADATSAAHGALAVEVAASSAVLLKNDAGALPISRAAKVALVGGACSADHVIEAEGDWRWGDYYVIGGSGRVVTSRATSIRAALAARGVQLVVSETDALDPALAAAQGADVVVACGGATATESIDRNTLALDQDDFLIQLADALRGHGAPLVVAAMAPGAILAPWAQKASAAVLMFLAGQATGEAWADVLLGDVSPSGKLPVTIPASEADVQQPCHSPTCEYSDRLNVGWKRLISKPVVYPFGHGLSYSRFVYSWAAGGQPAFVETPAASGVRGRLSLTATIANVGGVAAREVAQLYVAFPAASGEPLLNLRGFEKTPLLQPGMSHTFALTLHDRDLAVWDESVAGSGGGGGWRRVAGEFEISLGSSSRDLRLSAPLTVPTAPANLVIPPVAVDEDS